MISSMETKCLFPVAGYGTRFLPATKAMPKEMLPILNKPLIQYGVEEAAEAGLTDICFVTGRTKRAIEDHFDISFELEASIGGTGKEEFLTGIRSLIDSCTFSYTRQLQMLGLGHAILTGKKIIGKEVFGVVLADDLCFGQTSDGVMTQMMQVYEKFQCSVVAVEEVADSEVSKYGIVSGEEVEDGIIRLDTMIEKPSLAEAPSRLGVIGRYVLTPDIFDILENLEPGRNGEIQITDALMQQASEGRVLGYRFKGQRFDCGSVEGFVKATNYCFASS